jgi:prepilin-type N-terminal cleavage/methylation domain-containing protein
MKLFNRLPSLPSVRRPRTLWRRSQAGFTLIELLVVLFIIGCVMVVGAVIVYFVFFSGHVHIRVS